MFRFLFGCLWPAVGDLLRDASEDGKSGGVGLARFRKKE